MYFLHCKDCKKIYREFLTKSIVYDNVRIVECVKDVNGRVAQHHSMELIDTYTTLDNSLEIATYTSCNKTDSSEAQDICPYEENHNVEVLQLIESSPTMEIRRVFSLFDNNRTLSEVTQYSHIDLTILNADELIVLFKVLR